MTDELNFGSLRPPGAAQRSSDPETIFRTLPKTANTPNDLWRGQTDALREWHANRTLKDVLISLNTGAGKSLVGLLIAQSLVNEGIEHVVYICCTNDLVQQTAREADNLGLKYTTRMKGEFNNDLFETGRAFVITNYAAVFQPFTRFNTKYRIGAAIFDDAHVAERQVRDSFRLVFADERFKALNDDIRALFEDSFRKANRLQAFQDTNQSRVQDYLLASPYAVYQVRDQLTHLLRSCGIQDDRNLKYAWEHLKDMIGNCVTCLRTFIRRRLESPGCIRLAAW